VLFGAGEGKNDSGYIRLFVFVHLFDNPKREHMKEGCKSKNDKRLMGGIDDFIIGGI
jgi:hypothetical protein